MPHQCTTCGRTFPDGSKEMLSGCPDCGGNKFQFKPAGATDDDAGTGTSDPAGNAGPSDSSQPPTGADDPDDATTAAADPTPESAGASPTAGDLGGPADADGTEQIADRSDEDTAQASARSDVVSPDELDRASRDAAPDEPPAGEPAGEDGPRPGIGALRDELNDQFESIRIVSPGKYELNLMELYDRQEYIISLQEDGRYVIEMPDAWDVPDE